MHPGESVRFDMDEGILSLISDLEESKKDCRVILDNPASDTLKRSSIVRSIEASLAIEGNTLGLRAVSDVMDGRDIEGPFDEVVEVRNAVGAYRDLQRWDTWSVGDFLDAFDTLMFGLVEEPGFRRCGVGVFGGDFLIYRAPPHEEVPEMVERLFAWGMDSILPTPVVGAIVHYCIETIHPFVDGNGRMGRLWNTKINIGSDPLYALVPMESYIRRRRNEYYGVLEKCQSSEGHDCTRFVGFCLERLIEGFDDVHHLLRPYAIW